MLIKAPGTGYGAPKRIAGHKNSEYESHDPERMECVFYYVKNRGPNKNENKWTKNIGQPPLALQVSKYWLNPAG